MTCVVFDLDGTLADIRHRQNWLRHKPKNWRAFPLNIAGDKPIPQTIQLTHLFGNQGYTIVILTGREEGENQKVRKETEEWLKTHNVLWDYLFMRPHKDHTQDHIWKKQMMYEVIIPSIGRPEMIFEDRKRVCNMWAEEGFFCFDVGQCKGEF